MYTSNQKVKAKNVSDYKRHIIVWMGLSGLTAFPVGMILTFIFTMFEFMGIGFLIFGILLSLLPSVVFALYGLLVGFTTFSLSKLFRRLKFKKIISATLLTLFTFMCGSVLSIFIMEDNIINNIVYACFTGSYFAITHILVFRHSYKPIEDNTASN